MGARRKGERELCRRKEMSGERGRKKNFPPSSPSAISLSLEAIREKRGRLVELQGEGRGRRPRPPLAIIFFSQSKGKWGFGGREGLRSNNCDLSPPSPFLVSSALASPESSVFPLAFRGLARPPARPFSRRRPGKVSRRPQTSPSPAGTRRLCRYNKLVGGKS